MSTPFLMMHEIEQELKAAAERSRANVLPLSELMKHVPKPNAEVNVLKLEDRQTTPERTPEQVIIPFGYRVAISHEEQEPGICLHLSISSPTANKSLPVPQTLELVLEALQLEGKCLKVWIEEFRDHDGTIGKAINALALVEPRQEPPAGEVSP
jgi:hypothetical protein